MKRERKKERMREGGKVSSFMKCYCPIHSHAGDMKVEISTYRIYKCTYMSRIYFYRHYEFQNVYPESVNKEKMIAILFSNIPQRILSCIISLRKLQIEADRSIETVGIKHVHVHEKLTL